MSTKKASKKTKRKAKVSEEYLRKIFSVPESASSTLSQIENNLSQNMDGFLKDHLVASELNPHKIGKQFKDHRIPDHPEFISDYAKFLKRDIIPHAVHLSSEKFIGHMCSSIPYYMTSLSKIVTALNQNLVKIETSKSLTPLERQTIGMLHHLIYQREPDFYQKHIQDTHTGLGILCSGGTLANLNALWVARNKFFKGTDIAQAGLTRALKLKDLKDVVVLASDMVHYSVLKCMNILGLGTDQCLKIPCKNNFEMDVEALKKVLQSLQKKKIGCMAIVGIAGTTETGSIDPLVELASIAKKNRIFLHIDAAWGGPYLMSNELRPLLAGIEQADSVSLDAHKQLYTPMGAGLCFFKNPRDLKLIEHHADYIIRQGSMDLGMRSVEGGRPAMVLYIHSALRIFGKRGYAYLLEKNLEKTKDFFQWIEAQEDIEITSRPTMNIFTYRFKPKGVTENQLNILNTEVQKIQRDQGKSFVSRTRLYLGQRKDPARKDVVLRVIIANPLTQITDLKEVVEEQRLIVQKWIRSQ